MTEKVRSQSEKVKVILAKLERLKEVDSLPKKLHEEIANQNKAQQQTVSDDFDANKAKEQQIYLYEEIIRRALSMFDVSYDDLIRMDGKSAYCQAVQIYPHLLEEVRNADCPPLYALAISKSMQPYLEFTAKYGTSIEQIKQNLKEELKKENQEAAKSKVAEIDENTEEPKQASIFADINSAVTKNNKTKKTSAKEDSLADLFAN